MRRRFVLALLAATLAAPGAAHAQVHHELLGRSVQGRPITLTRVGDPAAAVKVLVVGCIHGNEPAGRAIVARLATSTPPAVTQLLLVRDLNPDGFQHHTRENAHGVDLNRNSSADWTPIAHSPVENPGPRPFSEPEDRAIRALILRERPNIAIWYHQHLTLVDPPEFGSWAMARAYARAVGLPLRNLGAYPGSMSRWENTRVRRGSSFVVELPAGSLSAAAVARHAAAVVALARRASGGEVRLQPRQHLPEPRELLLGDRRAQAFVEGHRGLAEAKECRIALGGQLDALDPAVLRVPCAGDESGALEAVEMVGQRRSLDADGLGQLALGG